MSEIIPQPIATLTALTNIQSSDDLVVTRANPERQISCTYRIKYRVLSSDIYDNVCNTKELSNYRLANQLYTISDVDSLFTRLSTEISSTYGIKSTINAADNQLKSALDVLKIYSNTTFRTKSDSYSSASADITFRKLNDSYSQEQVRDEADRISKYNDNILSSILDQSFMHNYGAETVSGKKTFTHGLSSNAISQTATPLPDSNSTDIATTEWVRNSNNNPLEYSVAPLIYYSSGPITAPNVGTFVAPYDCIVTLSWSRPRGCGNRSANAFIRLNNNLLVAVAAGQSGTLPLMLKSGDQIEVTTGCNNHKSSFNVIGTKLERR